MHGVAGPHKTEIYLANITLPNNVVITSLEVTKGVVSDSADVLIGMDIINRGDFAVTNLGGKTMFSFRMPSVEHIDFTQRHLPIPSRPKPKQ